jgi:hypothetical protein
LATGAGLLGGGQGDHSDGHTDEGASAAVVPMSPRKTKFEIKYEKELGLLSPVMPRKPVHVFVMFSDQHKDAIREEYKNVSTGTSCMDTCINLYQVSKHDGTVLAVRVIIPL